MGETEPTDAQYAEYVKQVDDDYNSYTCFDGSNYLMVSAGAALAAGLALIYWSSRLSKWLTELNLGFAPWSIDANKWWGFPQL